MNPIIPVLENIIVILLIGKYDDRRAEELIIRTLEIAKQYQAKFMVLGVAVLTEWNDYYIHMLDRLTNAVRLIGASVILVGISPSLGVQLVHFAFDPEGIACFSTLKHGIYYWLLMEGFSIIKNEK
ncbi:STAS domain-containing protein [Aneurinibacillus aneurinilyticus]|uniref:STAS domain-containing protein n=1 Tax=Aneurinibacillus aneurinilyticus ATCC 12856 TaxID=649747 RepID=U1W9J4_ANEAE|nr:STAS domain-containing protein [Aneurinibacillus aneurinilyticus]ERI05194.1 hypothetical protein HMPREF0083_05767 [Aneurinibacillus aneurinilyticus ATCC 12856]MED0708143.1 STAS domain-containing protein [Aneurinibacillus aneurinilyticus]MED0721504.1 STAS domain-containing protein [Aneurinibacillus aneurinilyticus]MED0734028.1 STAS domain-containing protein [Aneurinibacillus aneurinilyticus]MED0743155.1 STAS domain-containing protein [Aneurinibacillus aneurinilyticus]